MARARTRRTVFASLLALLLIAAGWDPGLQTRCAASPHPDQINYYEDTTECSGDGQWLAAVHSGNGPSTSCPGPTAQSFPIDEEGSPTAIGWEPRGQRWAVTLATEFRDNPHPCGDGWWTWFMFFDHLHHGGGPLPPPDEVRFTAFVKYSDWVSRGSAKGMASWQGYWDGRARYVELVFQATGIGDNDPDPLIINAPDLEHMQYVLVDGAAMGITVPRDTMTRLRVPWARIIKRLIAKGYLDAPSDWAQAKTTAVGIGHEVRGNQMATVSFERFHVAP